MAKLKSKLVSCDQIVGGRCLSQYLYYCPLLTLSKVVSPYCPQLLSHRFHVRPINLEGGYTLDRQIEDFHQNLCIYSFFHQRIRQFHHLPFIQLLEGLRNVETGYNYSSNLIWFKDIIEQMTRLRAHSHSFCNNNANHIIPRTIISDFISFNIDYTYPSDCHPLFNRFLQLHRTTASQNFY